MKKDGVDTDQYQFLKTELPNFTVKKGPIVFIKELATSAKRLPRCTFALNPKDEIIDIGPYTVDLYRYLKTELYNNWMVRSKASVN